MKIRLKKLSMKFRFLLLLLLSCLLSRAQTDSNAIRNIISLFFEGIRNADASLIKNSLDSSCFLFTVMQKKDGTTILDEEKVQEFLQQVSELKGQKPDERLLSYDIKTDGAMAMAWTPYKFYFNETFSHCGVNVFMLVKRNHNWKIMGITDTRRKENCE